MEELPRHPIDCLDDQGRRIRCHRSHWRLHVLDRRPYFAGMVDDVVATLQAPILVTQMADPRRTAYYRAAPEPFHDEMVKVIVEAGRLSKHGKLITAYLVRDVPPAERGKVLRGKPST